MVKGTKVLNPADKARKEARKKELKKNKKQRQQVRSAAIESTNPEQVISDLEKLDRFEFDVATNPSMSDTFYKDKRKRLRGMLTKILLYYQKEDPDRHAKLKKLESEYENNHNKLLKEFEAIKAAQEVKIEDIFLPPETISAIDEISDDDPLLSESVYITPLTDGIKPPGCPPGLPPDLKQLIDSLKSSIVNPIVANSPATLHPSSQKSQIFERASNLSNQSKSANFKRTYHSREDKVDNRNGHLEQKTIVKPKPQAEMTAKDEVQVTSQLKSAVIESKPVLFKPKVTKFVPSSVRSKISREKN